MTSQYKETVGLVVSLLLRVPELRGRCKVHALDHIKYWQRLIQAGAAPALSEYDEYARARIPYIRETLNKFSDFYNDLG